MMFSEVANWSTYMVVSKVYRIFLVKKIFFEPKRREKNNFLKKNGFSKRSCSSSPIVLFFSAEIYLQGKIKTQTLQQSMQPCSHSHHTFRG